ncbi:diadenylate cyclase CdaA [Acetivibrio sp. MSJd-27]|jgi:TIGR00159 family protein|uniref:diadenylate cyclase CdaA n=1 Tax=Acetivibrio sp. MSJd-27 TaxID=2841523 RepID=UPI0015A8507A|nr:diadenylate cyclase CdaA [Acetivibrio sp. MSJd-27]MBU5449756.1 diadenylate cyclase CdaA [Acetivibrio sp. MSJd-27]
MPSSYFLSTIRFTDILDILIVAYLIYKIVGYFRETRAFQLLKGIVILLVFMQLSEFMQLNTISFILRNTMQVGVIALIVIFQPELRRALTQIGNKKLSLFGVDENEAKTKTEYVVGQVTEACEMLSKQRIGALIVFQRETKIGDIIRTGINMDSEVSSELLINIFIPNTPLHDGAVIIGANKIKASACFLPLSQNENLSKELGTRHRAGIGITESSDAVAVIVSEETGKISIAMNGTLTRNIAGETLQKALLKMLASEKSQKADKKKSVWRFGKK